MKLIRDMLADAWDHRWKIALAIAIVTLLGWWWWFCPRWPSYRGPSGDRSPGTTTGWVEPEVDQYASIIDWLRRQITYPYRIRERSRGGADG